ncbi:MULTISPECIES: hypothetical protein [Candidatus Ichthyocystis]|uniref:Putative membrane protein n=1 Tax=Candidatus Ichthyocystis hellenicum TaxID=1561003 RepID=A0A0S4M6E7_9BURK|nr:MULTISPECIES: hypothetical protein [Ichthyocystis]CUT17846.1 putative membrane protein [Candidatus Ichthyocystis hellenicum]
MAVIVFFHIFVSLSLVVLVVLQLEKGAGVVAAFGCVCRGYGTMLGGTGFYKHLLGSKIGVDVIIFFLL